MFTIILFKKKIKFHVTSMQSFIKKLFISNYMLLDIIQVQFDIFFSNNNILNITIITSKYSDYLNKNKKKKYFQFKIDQMLS